MNPMLTPQARAQSGQAEPFPALDRFNAMLDGMSLSLVPRQRLLADALLAARKGSGKTYLVALLALADPDFAETYAMLDTARAKRSGVPA